MWMTASSIDLFSGMAASRDTNGSTMQPLGGCLTMFTECATIISLVRSKSSPPCSNDLTRPPRGGHGFTLLHRAVFFSRYPDFVPWHDKKLYQSVFFFPDNRSSLGIEPRHPVPRPPLLLRWMTAVSPTFSAQAQTRHASRNKAIAVLGRDSAVGRLLARYRSTGRQAGRGG